MANNGPIVEMRRHFDLLDQSVTVFRRNLIVNRINFAKLFGRRFSSQTR